MSDKTIKLKIKEESDRYSALDPDRRQEPSEQENLAILRELCYDDGIKEKE